MSVRPSVGWLVGHTFEFLSKVSSNPTCVRHSRLEVDKVADMVVDEVADTGDDMEMNKVATRWTRRIKNRREKENG